MSGSLAYSTIFSIAPLIILIISLADIFYGRDAIEGTIYGQIRSFVGSDAAAQMRSLMAVKEQPSGTSAGPAL